MIRFPSTLQVRILLTFGIFSITVTLLLAVFILVSYEAGQEGAVQKVFVSEAVDFIRRAEADPAAPLPDSAFIHAYRGTGEMPDELRRNLARFEKEDYDIPLYEWKEIQLYIREHPDPEETVYLFFDLGTTADQALLNPNLRRVFYLVVPLFLGFSAWMSWLFAQRLSRPLRRLAGQIDQLSPGDSTTEIGAGIPGGEIATLAAAFNRQQERIRAFIEREHRFTRHASHELRTPLTVAGGASDNLFRGYDRMDGKSRRAVDILRQSIEEMQATVEALLWLSREHFTPRQDPTCPSADIVERCIRLHRTLVEGKPVDIRTSLTCREHRDFPSDLFRIAASNLIRNAFQYTRSGHVAITLDDAGLTVESTSGGKTGPTPGDAGESTGLGLAIVRKITERCGWSLAVSGPETDLFTVTIRFA